MTTRTHSPVPAPWQVAACEEPEARPDYRTFFDTANCWPCFLACIAFAQRGGLGRSLSMGDVAAADVVRRDAHIWIEQGYPVPEEWR